MKHFTFYKLNLDGTLTNKQHLNSEELDGFMEAAYGKFANVLVEDEKGNQCIYSDNGRQWELLTKKAAQ